MPHAGVPTLKYGDQRKLCRTCKGPVRTIALTACYHAPLCGRCNSRLRHFFNRLNCYECGHLESKIIYTWKASLQYEDFDLKNDERLAYDPDIGVVYQDHSERNKDRRMLSECNEKIIPKEIRVENRNAVCRIMTNAHVKGLPDGLKVLGTGFLIDLLGHKCMLTAYNVIKTPLIANNAWVEFCLENTTSSHRQEHIKHGHYKHTHLESIVKAQVRPDFLFLSHISLNFTVVGLDHEVLEETNIKCIPLPKKGETPNIKEEEAKEKKEGKVEGGDEGNENDGEQIEKPKRRKRNFVIVKKKKKGAGDEEEDDAEGKKSDRPFPTKNDIIEIIGFPLREQTKRSDVQLIDSVEGDNLIYKMDSEQQCSGAPVFFNMTLVAVHNQSDLKENADEATTIFSILKTVYSHREKSLKAVVEGIIHQPYNKAVQLSGSKHLSSYATHHAQANVLVKCNAIGAFLSTCTSCFQDYDILEHALKGLLDLCSHNVKYQNIMIKLDAVKILVNVIENDAKYDFDHTKVLSYSWNVLGNICQVTSAAHELCLLGGPMLSVKSIHSAVSDLQLVLGCVKAIRYMSVDEQHHLSLIKSKIVGILFLAAGAHYESEVMQLACVQAMGHLIANRSAMPCNSSFLIKPVKQSGRKPPPLKTSSFRRKKKEEVKKIVIPTINGRRDRQLMKRNLQPTVMATIGAELGQLVQNQPRALIMWTRNGLGTLFEAMKAFPKSNEIAEKVWGTMEHIRDEALSKTDTAIELHGSHLHIMKKSLRRMKKHPDVEKWRALYEVLEANNERKKNKKR
jgi:hypothetical protein